jgi:hypothetical protein
MIASQGFPSEREVVHAGQRGGMLPSQHPRTYIQLFSLQLFRLLSSPLITVRRRQVAYVD